MKSTGIFRRLDELVRILISIELRRVLLDIEVKDAVEIFVEEVLILLKMCSANIACSITGEVTNKNKVYANGN